MVVKRIPFVEAKLYKPLIEDYLSLKPATQSLYEFAPSLDVSDELIDARRAKQPNRKVLVESLLRQYEGYNLAETPLVKKGIESLANSTCFTVTTGHQLNLFGGTQYFIYKIVDTLCLARDLKEKHPDLDFTPIFWMASEDHDFQEINRAIINKETFTWESGTTGCVGRMNPQPIKLVLENLSDFFGEEPVTGKHLERLFKEAYSLPTLAEATRYWVHELFKDYGLVILDGDDKALKKSFSPIIKQEILQQVTAKHVEETNEHLESNKYHVQVYARSINFFYAKDGIRERLIETSKGYAVHDTDITFSEQEMVAEIDKHPEHFSPNALMRPMYQEHILPNLTYIGGAGEIAYWLQLKRAFKGHGVFFPQLMVRNSVVWLSSKSLHQLDKLGLSLLDLFSSKELVLQHYKEGKNGLPEVFAKLDVIAEAWQEIMNTSDTLKGATKITAGMFSAEKLHELKKFKQLLRKSVSREHERELETIEGLFEAVFPNGHFQERHHTFLPSYMQMGAGYVDTLLKSFTPFGHEVLVAKN